MYNKSKLLAFAGTTLALFAVTAPAHAQATRTWVSGVGDDLNPCSRTAPCKTFAGAISKTFINGEIDCLDPARLWRGDDHQIHHHRLHRHLRFDPCQRHQRRRHQYCGQRQRSVQDRAAARPQHQRCGCIGTVGTRTGIRGVRILDAAVVMIEES